MRENSKILVTGQSQNRLRATDCVLPVHGTMSATAIPRPFPVLDAGRHHCNREAMECFGGAILELLECSRCFVAVVPEDGDSTARQVRIGHSIPNQIPASLVAQIARKLTSEDAVLSSANSDDTLARSVIGCENRKSARSLIGRTRCGDGRDVVFVAGWQASPISTDRHCLALTRDSRNLDDGHSSHAWASGGIFGRACFPGFRGR